MKRRNEDKKSKVSWSASEDDALLKAILEDKQDREAASGIISKLRGMLDDETFGPRIVNLIKMYNKEKGQAIEPEMDAKPDLAQ